jgi:hypothetical protein
MADDARTATGFWRTVPGILTAVAGLITAVAGLVAALTQAGVLGGGGKPDARPAAPTVALDGRWRARVSYPWGVTRDEVFTLRVEDGRVLGTATYLGVPRAVENGAVAGTRVEFTTRAEEFSGADRRTYENHYDGLLSPRGIHFELRDSRGGAPVEFTAGRAP